MLKLILFVVLFLSLLSSCKKEKAESLKVDNTCDTLFVKNYSFDTVFPSEYLMTYPGSWWLYTDGITLTCDSWKTVSIAKTTSSNKCVTVNEDMNILPNTNFGIFSFESYIKSYTNYQSTDIVHFIDTISGVISVKKETSGQDQGICHKTTTISFIEKLTFLSINGVDYFDVIHIKEFTDVYYPHGPSAPSYTIHKFYSKGIGIIRKINQYGSWTNDTIDLVNHHIEPY